MVAEEKPVSGVGLRRMNLGRYLTQFGIDSAAVAYAMTTVGAGMINNIFSFYYVKLFINKYKVSEAAFHQSQASILFFFIYFCSFYAKCLSLFVKNTLETK